MAPKKPKPFDVGTVVAKKAGGGARIGRLSMADFPTFHSLEGSQNRLERNSRVVTVKKSD
jgi:hypothetical protein